jgi:amino acid permease
MGESLNIDSPEEPTSSESSARLASGEGEESQNMVNGRIETTAASSGSQSDPEERRRPPETLLASSSVSAAAAAASHVRSSLGAIANLCSATLGAGILSLPFAFYLTGWVVGTLMMIGSAWATVTSIRILARASEIRHSAAYEVLVEQHLSPQASAATRLCIVVFCFGCAVAYIIAIGDLFQRLGLPRIPSMTAMWASIMLPLSCQRSMKSLQCASSIGITSISMLVVCAAIQLWLDWGVDHVPDGIYNESHHLQLWPSHGLLGIFKACPIILFAFSCQVNVCAIYHELEVTREHEDLDGDDEDFRAAIQQGYIEEDPASLHPMPPSRLDNNVAADATAAETVALVRSDSRTADEALEADVSDSEKSRAFDAVTYSAVGVCATLYTSISIVALLEFETMTPNVLARYSVSESIMQVAAAAVGMAVILAFPLNVVPARTSLARSLLHPPELAGGSPTMPQQPRRQQVQEEEGGGAHGHGSRSRSHVQTPLFQENRVRVRSRHRPVGTLWHALLTLVVAGGALVAAMLIPDISVVFGLLGGTTTSWLGFCLPGYLGIKLLSKPWKFVSWLLLAGGVVIGVVTTVVTVATMF